MNRSIEDYGQVQIVRTNRKIKVVSLKKKIVIPVALIMLFVAIVITFFTIFSPFTITIKGGEFHVLILQSYDDAKEAEVIKDAISSAGAGGYIFNNGRFQISACAYTSKNDAEVVRQRLSSTYPKAYTIEFKIKKHKYNRFNTKKDDKNIKNVYEYPIEYINTIISLVFELDSFKISDSEALLKVKDLKSQLSEKRKTVVSLLNNYPTFLPFEKLLEVYESMEENLAPVMSLEDITTPVTHNLKYYSCLLIDKYYEFRTYITSY
jgi:hypothetical protein